MSDNIKDYIFNHILGSRIRVMIAIMVIFSCILGGRLFYLQIVKGEEYQSNYNLKAEKTETISATRGNIYDRNGNLLAYNELAYAVTIEDSGTYRGTEDKTRAQVKNETLNAEIATLIEHLEANGDSIDNDFDIILNDAGEYEFTCSGSTLQRFRADIFGRSSVNELKYNSKIELDEANASADEIMSYLMGRSKYDVSQEYPEAVRYQITVVRYKMSLNSYQKYLSTTIASNVSDETVAYVEENLNELTGISIEQQSVRKYVDAEYFSHIIGYTGLISSEEYDELKDTGDYTLTDVIGKAGMEQYMDSYLTGKKGYEKLYVDKLGNPLQVIEHKDAVAGNDVYLSIDKDLQEATYRLLEQEIAGIVYSKIANIKEYNVREGTKASDILIPIYDVYFTLINNNLIRTSHFSADDATDTERAVLQSFESRKVQALETLREQLTAENPKVYNTLSDEYQAYSTYIVTMLKEKEILDADAIDKTSDIYKTWTSERLSVKDYLTYGIEQNWIDNTKFTQNQKYVDTDELYAALVDTIIQELESDSGFDKLVYQHLILQDKITGSQLCAILYEQGVLEWDENSYQAVKSGRISAYSFLKSKIKALELTPAQLALEPCSGSSVIIDTNTGELLACVTYPGYDTNRLANTMDSEYYSYLNQSLSNPLYNHATQQRTAPGSTFKLVSATAGLADGVINTSSTIQDKGVYEKVSNKPRCWRYPSNHGVINVSQAIRDSCNYFFYEIGWRLSGGDNNYNDATGIEKIQYYGGLYGLNEKTGIELVENTSKIATEYPVMAAIGQSDNNITTIALARYVTAVANEGTVYNLSLLSKVTDKDGNVLETYGPTVRNQIDVLSSGEWAAFHSGMRMVAENLSSFNGIGVSVAGKTGTAEITHHPNHALFVGYAPYENPQIAIATRIAYGYTSHNAADVSGDVIQYYFSRSDDLLNGGANDVSSGNSVTD